MPWKPRIDGDYMLGATRWFNGSVLVSKLDYTCSLWRFPWWWYMRERVCCYIMYSFFREWWWAFQWALFRATITVSRKNTWCNRKPVSRIYKLYLSGLVSIIKPLKISFEYTWAGVFAGEMDVRAKSNYWLIIYCLFVILFYYWVNACFQLGRFSARPWTGQWIQIAINRL